MTRHKETMRALDYMLGVYPNNIKTLSCCCCGESTKGRQWHNRDTGYGICEKCITWMRECGTSEAEIANLYGKEGEHFNVKGGAA